jgi:multidrug transporter EmrE-like cation transporter
VLISKPGFLLGTDEKQGRVAWLGYILALGAGISSGGCFIAARKSQEISPWLLTCSVTAQEGLALLLLSMTGIMSESFSQMIQEASYEFAGIFVAMLALVCFACATLSGGAQMCPAAVSSSIFTSTSMLLGYLSQLLMHHDAPDGLTMVGVSLMLMGVVLMALARWRYSEPAQQHKIGNVASPCERDASGEEDKSTSSLDIAQSDVDETESIMSFVASEFSGVSLTDHSIRQRAVAAVGVIGGTQAIGAALA